MKNVWVIRKKFPTGTKFEIQCPNPDRPPGPYSVRDVHVDVCSMIFIEYDLIPPDDDFRGWAEYSICNII